MKGKKLLIVTAACIAALGMNCTAVMAKSSGTLRVGVREDIMNFSYLNEQTGNFYGMEIDLARELAERLGYSDTEWVVVTPDDRKEILMSGEVDCVIAAYSIAETRLANFDFSEPYYHDATRVMVEKSTLFDSLEDLIGQKIGIVDGSNAGHVYVEKLAELGLIPDMEEATLYEMTPFVRLGSYSELSDALETGEVDAALMDGCIAATYMDSDRVLLDEELEEQNYGVATQKGSELSGRVASAIQEMLDDGTIDKLIDKWD